MVRRIPLIGLGALLLVVAPMSAAVDEGVFKQGTLGARAYRLYVPGGAPTGPLPLVIALHGCFQTPDYNSLMDKGFSGITKLLTTVQSTFGGLMDKASQVQKEAVQVAQATAKTRIDAAANSLPPAGTLPIATTRTNTAVRGTGTILSY